MDQMYEDDLEDVLGGY